MKKIRLLSPCLFVAALSISSTAYGQASRTWVSGVGDDVNPCSRTAPCKTFAGAISKTAENGEINVLDPGGYGALTITKAITIVGGGTMAGGIAADMTNGIIVNAGATDRVVLRGLSIQGHGTGLNGIRYLAGESLTIEDCAIEGFTQNNIDVALTAAGKLTVNRTTMTGGAAGVKVNSTTGRVTAVLSDVLINATGTAVESRYGSTVLRDSTLSNNTSYAVNAFGGSVSVIDSVVAGNGVALNPQVGASIRMSNSHFYDNLTGFACGGTLASDNTNRKGNNMGGVVAVCNPNSTVMVQ